MRPTTLGLLAAACAVCGPRATAQPALMDDVALTDGRLGFCGVSLGDPADSFGDEFRGPEDQEVSRTLCGRTVTIGVRVGADGSAYVGLLWIPRRDEDPADQWGLEAMQARMREKLPAPYYFEGVYEEGLTEAEDTSPQYRVDGADGQFVALKPEEAVYMEYGDGWD